MLTIQSISNKIKNIYRRHMNGTLERKRSVLLQKYGVVSLKNIIEILEINNIFYWIDAGTLLGIIRDGKFIDNDTDIDIAIVIDDPDQLYKLLIANDYNIWYYYDEEDKRKNLIRAEKHNVGIDFEIFYKEGEKFFYDAPRALPKSIKRQAHNQNAILRFEFDADTIKNIEQYQFNNITLNIPKNYNKYFVTYYENWKVKLEKKNYLNSYFVDSVDNYKHHNSLAYYKKDDYLYFHSVNPTSITVNLLDGILSLVNK